MLLLAFVNLYTFFPVTTAIFPVALISFVFQNSERSLKHFFEQYTSEAKVYIEKSLFEGTRVENIRISC